MNEESQSPPDEQPKSLGRKLLIGLGALLLAVILLLIIALIYLRHVPLEITPAEKIPGKQAKGPVSVRYIGVSGYVISDGETTIVLDPAMNRPQPLELISGRLQPDPKLPQKYVPKADYVLVNHAHYDHSIDAPEIAVRTGARVLGSQNVANLTLSRGAAPTQVMVVTGGEELKLGTFKVKVAKARHGPIMGKEQPMSGDIPKDAGKLWFFQYKLDKALSYRLESKGVSIWFHPSTLYQAGECDSPATYLIMGVNGVPIKEEAARNVIKDVNPKVILPTHYDNFFQPMSKGLSIFPGLDMDRARRLLAGESKDRRWYVLDYGETLELSVTGQ